MNPTPPPNLVIMTTPKFTVAIAGGGIAGLTLAIALGKCSDIDVQLYEAASKFGELGVGLRFAPRSWKIFEKLGVDQEFLKHTSQTPSSTDEVPMGILRKSNQPEGFQFGYLRMTGRPMMFHRADAQAALLAGVPASGKVSLSKRLASYTRDDSGRIHLVFQDGTKAECDILIGADGYKSVVRRDLLKERAKLAKSEEKAAEILSATDPLFTGAIAYRTVVSSDKVLSFQPDHSVFKSDNAPVLYSGLNAFIASYPIQHGKLVNLATYQIRPELENTTYDGLHATHAPGSEFAAVFEGFEPEVQAYVKSVDQIAKWAIHSVKPMSTFVHRNVALIGDAAHAMTPFLGSGASQAVEDAYILATTLGHPKTTRDPKSIERALAIYDEIRRPVALAVQEASRKSGQISSGRLAGAELDYGARLDPKDPKTMEVLKSFERACQELVTASHAGTIEESYQEALRRLESD